jgi:hypothetical protein
VSSRPEKRDTTGIVAHNCRTRQACALMGRLCRCRQQIQLCEERKPRSVWRSYPGPPGSYCFIVSITVCVWVESTEFSTAKLPTNFTNPRPKGGLYCIHYVIQSVFRRQKSTICSRRRTVSEFALRREMYQKLLETSRSSNLTTSEPLLSAER